MLDVERWTFCFCLPLLASYFLLLNSYFSPSFLWKIPGSLDKITFPPMPSPEENGGAVTSPLNDVQENVRRFNEDEAVWRCFARKRKRRKRLLRLLRLLDPQPPLTDKQLDDLDWLAAEREARPVRAIGKWIAP